MPMTSPVTLSDITLSARIPATFLSKRYTSFTHLIKAGLPENSSTVRAVASAAIIVTYVFLSSDACRATLTYAPVSSGE